MFYTIKSRILQSGQSCIVAECVKLPMVTQGRTLGDVTANLCEAIGLHSDDENLATLRL